jgi:hypothetical protein
MRLNGTRNIDRLPIAIGKIGDPACCRQLLHSSPECFSARNCPVRRTYILFRPRL